MSGDEATLILSESLDFPETGRIVRMNVWSVPASDAYPDGIKYRLHYGTGEGETILRYDNSHADTKGHERHTADGVDGTYEYPGDYKAVLERFRTEVENHERTD
ncbi:hypothetical protein HacjB3_18278 (plasmid) [Halalkalicoccus jeotgali B3]|uniref:Uncharacterized protein n=1 Tax=Halalkalicoccus jeotgali (strain DSM 18796 / CECT 7217 / JCM 14584 / KCTC 4019 / B3) TaxID=795797 RepID=D8JC60_HALJB|nr:DUF6516 family protein [Halalkalicoccus jeotgali]ADJ16967.1 hypothetical protein HacjB3_18123 [Halalkalicoccus jeotgali B3]ADJ16998.1 hypothetical protein HacjB3_18278 [Halalkalicoccus jeotgali B3]